MKTKRTACISILLAGLLAGGCGPGASDQDEALAVISIKNTGSAERKEEVVEIPYADIAARLEAGQTFRITDSLSGEGIPYQLEYRGEDQPVHVLVQVSLPAGGEATFQVEPGEADTIAPKTFARYVPERKDDFAWENDQIAFRMYGKALEGTDEDAHGTDVWVKSTDKLIIDKWYKEDDYHADHGEGLDYYKVGLTLGAGDIAPYIDGKIRYSKHYRGHEVLDNGALRSTFRLDYEDWKAGGLTTRVSKTISIDAGSRMNRVEVQYTTQGEEALPVAAGIVQRDKPGETLAEEESGIIGYWEPEDEENGITGVGVVLTGPVTKIDTAEGHLLGVFSAGNHEPRVYYSGAAWNKAGAITTAEEWFAYLRDFKEKLGQPLQVEVR